MIKSEKQNYSEIIGSYHGTCQHREKKKRRRQIQIKYKVFYYKQNMKLWD